MPVILSIPCVYRPQRQCSEDQHLQSRRGSHAVLLPPRAYEQQPAVSPCLIDRLPDITPCLAASLPPCLTPPARHPDPITHNCRYFARFYRVARPRTVCIDVVKRRACGGEGRTRLTTFLEVLERRSSCRLQIAPREPHITGETCDVELIALKAVTNSTRGRETGAPDMV
ncbi:hypothetical protein E2C01_084450 [Portunus trituberculatus]|uniref:Uncharacterized protein n=1 Tax=Portunus trituberculatus TaxID=210409 RepID=A0A5B7J482_PORTR|nr:hypothetical protein [Portunus trituberculatus]